MKISIVCVGKIKEKYLTEGIAEFTKRLTPYCKLETIAIGEEKMPDNPSPAEKEQVLAKETERLGHIGTHMDCYMEAPRYKEYVTDAVVVDCRNGLPADEYFNNLDIEGKALVLYTGNMATNDYATKDFFMFDMKLNWDSLAALLYNHPKFILIDSHGLGMFSQHRLFDMECEKNGCFLIMCLMLEGEEILNIKKLKIEIDKEMPSTGKPCRVYGF